MTKWYVTDMDGEDVTVHNTKHDAVFRALCRVGKGRIRRYHKGSYEYKGSSGEVYILSEEAAVREGFTDQMKRAQERRKPRARAVGRGWYFDPYRHSLAARGIKSRAIPNPHASPEHYDAEWYRRKGEKEPRKFKGSGLEGINKDMVVLIIQPLINILQGYDMVNGGHLDPEDYGSFLRQISRNIGVSDERVQEFWDRDENFLEVKAIYIMGSRVTGYHTQESDLDVYIQFEDRPEFHRQFDDIHMDQTTTVDDFFDDLLGSVYLAMDSFGGTDDITVMDSTTGKHIKVDIGRMGIEPPKVPAIKVWGK